MRFVLDNGYISKSFFMKSIHCTMKCFILRLGCIHINLLKLVVFLQSQTDSHRLTNSYKNLCHLKNDDVVEMAIDLRIILVAVTSYSLICFRMSEHQFVVSRKDILHDAKWHTKLHDNQIENKHAILSYHLQFISEYSEQMTFCHRTVL